MRQVFERMRPRILRVKVCSDILIIVVCVLLLLLFCEFFYRVVNEKFLMAYNKFDL